MSTHAANLRKRRLANKAGGNPDKGKPISGERSASNAARVVRRTNARIRAKQRAEAEALAKKQRELDRDNRRQNITTFDDRALTTLGISAL